MAFQRIWFYLQSKKYIRWVKVPSVRLESELFRVFVIIKWKVNVKRLILICHCDYNTSWTQAVFRKFVFIFSQKIDAFNLTDYNKNYSEFLPSSSFEYKVIMLKIKGKKRLIKKWDLKIVYINRLKMKALGGYMSNVILNTN